MGEKGFLGERRGEVGCSTENNSLACLSTSERLENAITRQDTKEDTDDVKMTSGTPALYQFE